MFEHGFPKHWTTLKKLIWLVGSGIAGGAKGIWKTVTGTLIHITDALASPMQKCEVSLEPIQAGSGDPSPDNVRPITGWTGCEVTRTGKNVFQNEVWADNPAASRPASWTVNGDTIVLTKQALGTATMTAGFDCDLKAGQTYSLSVKSITLDNDETVVPNLSLVNFDGSITNVGTVTEGFTPQKNVSHFRFAIVNSSSSWLTATVKELQIEKGSSSTEYELPNITTASVTFPDSTGTVYGGTYDFVSGGLKPYKEYDSYNGETLTGEWMSDRDKYVAGTTPTIGAQVVDLDGYDTTVQLTPQPISTLKGVNNVWSNSNGETTLIYKAQAE